VVRAGRRSLHGVSLVLARIGLRGFRQGRPHVGVKLPSPHVTVPAAVDPKPLRLSPSMSAGWSKAAVGSVAHPRRPYHSAMVRTPLSVICTQTTIFFRSPKFVMLGCITARPENTSAPKRSNENPCANMVASAQPFGWRASTLSARSCSLVSFAILVIEAAPWVH
jgi:hypothetical protein